MNYRNKSASAHQFAMVPRADIPRSAFNMNFTHKTTFDAGYLIPVLCEEVLPGDTFSVKMTAFARLATPIFPIMDNLYLDSFFFYVPNRLLWSNWVKFMGEQDNPGDSTSYVLPDMAGTTNGYPVGSIYDYFGLPTAGQVQAGLFTRNQTLPLRAYNRIWNAWFRDENLQNSVVQRTTDSGDTLTDFNLLKRGKRHDYFTSALPWPQKGGTSVSIPLGTSAPVKTASTQQMSGAQTALTWREALTGATPPASALAVNPAGDTKRTASDPGGATTLYPSNLYADLSTATAATINQLRQSFQIQKLLERDARGGTRYTEIVRSHFGVLSPDARLDRPEYLGGGTQRININPIAQNSATGLTGGSTPIGTLTAMGTVVADASFRQSFVEHGYIIGLVSVRADLTYQQGLRRHWSRSTRYDFYWPAFANLGEQTILNKEIYARGDANDALVFGYQERWAEYRYTPSQITGLFRSTSAGTIHAWHLSQQFTSLPTLGATFIEESPPLSRILAVGAGANGQQIIFDSFFDIHAVRPMPLYSVPGLIDHF
uniref:Putative capsid VP1 n=1 Tax=uncultured virus TaxID=340016 RepID=A0A1D8MK72_9VIRU|nr:putative capsid VP1 [uncultured virus]